ncbi:MAG TPA: ABC transporter ATP-binding protein [Eubacteriales bacterium]|nr:ABC transporter ATP-binding protein [Eubacteriales bacterium]
MEETAIRFENFGFQYKVQQKPTLYDINLTIRKGEKVLILGSSGSGKSTLANCINGLIPFSNEGTITGSITVNGVETRSASLHELSKAVGTVLQDSDAQFVGLSVGEDIAFAMENEAIPRSEMVPVVYRHASVVGMQDFIGAVPFDLSGGQKQKVAIAGVLGSDVSILIFDEPLAALDPQMGQTAVELIDNLSQNGEDTIIIIEHRLEDVLHRRVDRVILMSEGRIVSDSTPDELLQSTLLRDYGIREPLYITAMKYAGCSITGNLNLCDIHCIEFTKENRTKLLEFFDGGTSVPQEDTGEEVIRLEGVDFAYDEGVNVVSDVSFSIHKGERIAVIGKNGAGKSTTAKLICGIARPQRGRVFIGKKDAKGLSVKEIGEHVGYVMQNPNQMILKDTIKAEVEFALTVRGTSQDEIRERATDALNACSLYPMRNWPVDTVSYGQKKRITVASILVLHPDVLILDEPSAGQDYKSYMEIMHFIDRLNREYGITILFITHDMHLALENTDRAIVFADGRLIADDRVFAVLANDEVIQRANLKQTSLYTLALRLELPPEQVIRRFIEHERSVKAGE